MGYLERNFVVKWIEWNPVPFTLKSKESLPSKYSFGLTQLSLTLLLPMGVLGYLSHDWPVAWQLLPLYLSLFIFGMPHGGADHLLIWGMIKNSSFGFRIGTLLAYPILSMIYLAVWNLQPLPSALFFLGLTVFHWGQGDHYLSVKLHQAIYLERSGLLKWLHVFSRGSIPILLPGYLGNETYREFAEAIVRQGGQVQHELVWISQNPLFFLFVPLGLTALQLLLSLLRLEKGEGKALRFDALEAGILFLWFLFVPPLWAIGSYFALWHSLRHGLRILWIDQEGRIQLQSSQFLKLKFRWLQLTGLMTLLALVGLWFILALPLNFRGIQLDWLGKAMLGISILTLPHTVVVCFMDKLQLNRVKSCC